MPLKAINFQRVKCFQICAAHHLTLPLRRFGSIREASRRDLQPKVAKVEGSADRCSRFYFFIQGCNGATLPFNGGQQHTVGQYAHQFRRF